MTEVAIGEVLAGKYRVTKVLGIGGMGVVVAATHIQLDEPVALKFMLPDALKSPEAVARFLREARAAVKLRSEHVARVSDVGTLETGAPYIVMEYLEGTDLAGALAERGPMPPEMAVEYVLQACDALAEAHAMGIVHRDLKPANLFLTHRKDATPLVKVLDFGISKSSALNEQHAGALTKTGGIMGSPLYMSPEQMKSAKDADARADIWALGVILYELLGGRTPFDCDTIGGLMALVLTEPPPPLSSVRAGLPLGLTEAIGRCLEKDRNNRWPTVAHLAAALGPFAPVGAHPLVERIAIVLGQTPMLAASRAGANAASPDVRATGTSSAPASGWGATGNRAPSRSSAAPFVAIGIAAVVLVGGGGYGAFRHFSTQASAAPSATAPTPDPPQTPSAAPAAAPSSAASTSEPAPPTPPAASESPPVVQPTSGKKSPVPGKKPPATSAPAAPSHESAQPSTPPPKPAKAPQGGLFDTSN